MLPNALLPNRQYSLCLEKRQALDGVYELAELSCQLQKLKKREEDCEFPTLFFQQVGTILR